MNWLERYYKNKEKLIDANLYNPSQEHDACGVGFIASIDGIPNKRVVTSGIEALKAVWHRGAVDADGKTCLLYTSPSPRDLSTSRMPSSA